MLTFYAATLGAMRRHPATRAADAASMPARTGPGTDDRRRLMAIMDLGGRQPWGRGS